MKLYFLIPVLLLTNSLLSANPDPPKRLKIGPFNSSELRGEKALILALTVANIDKFVYSKLSCLHKDLGDGTFTYASRTPRSWLNFSDVDGKVYYIQLYLFSQHHSVIQVIKGSGKDREYYRFDLKLEWMIGDE